MLKNYFKNIRNIKVFIDLLILNNSIKYYKGFSYSDICNLLKQLQEVKKWQEKKVDLAEKPGTMERQ